MHANLWDDSDSDDDLPAEWEQTVQGDFIAYYNRLTGFTQKPHPISGHVKQLPSTLPKSWSSCFDESGKTLYLNSETGCSTYSDPRLASASLAYSRKLNMNHQFKYDKFSSVKDILLNKDLRGQYALVTNSGCGLGLSIALHLVKHGAVVVCACSKCPNKAIPLLKHTETHNKTGTIVDVISSKSAIQDSGQLFWIPYDPLQLSSITQSLDILQSLNWPLHFCIIADDMFPVVSPHLWNFSFLKSFQSHLKAFFLQRTSGWLASISRYLRSYQSKVCKVIAKVLPSSWRPPLSCGCPSKLNSLLTTDGYEITMQCNYIAPALFLTGLFKTRYIHSSHSSDIQLNSSVHDQSSLRVVVVTSEVHKDASLDDFIIKRSNVSETFQAVPVSLVDRMKQYAISKVFMLLFVNEYQNRLREDSRNGGFSYPLPSIFACTGCDPFSVYCVRRCVLNFYYWFFTNPFLLLLQLVYLLSRPFGVCLDQATASPVFCAMDKFTNYGPSSPPQHSQCHHAFGSVSNGGLLHLPYYCF
ncbi:unnamed protein product [Trichobilharzia szidati]|nr:unnamed protein product [Trichobilharzia szidati]